MEAIVAGAVAGTIPDHQLAAWLMAVTCRGMSPAETAALTAAMVASGATLSPGRLGQTTVDYLATAGGEDPVTLIACPLAAALGARVPRLCARDVSGAGGTLDRLESLPGLTVDLDRERFLGQVEEIGIAIGAWPEQLAPADRILSALREVTGTVPSVPLIAAGSMAKMLAAGVAGMVLDISFGRGFSVSGAEAAHELAVRAIDIGSLAGRRVTALLTAIESPPGRAAGDALEVREAVGVLEGGGDPGLREMAVTVASEMCALGGVVGNPGAALDSGTGLERFWALVEAQGGRRQILPEPAPEVAVVTALDGGWVQAVDTRGVRGALRDLRSGRHRESDAVDHGVGIWLEAVAGAEVRWGDPLCRVHARSPAAAAAVEPQLREAWRLGPEAPALGPRIRGRLASTPFPRA